jgi:hypothetical protein
MVSLFTVIWLAFASAVLVATPVTIRRIREKESDFKVAAPALSVVAFTAFTAGAFLLVSMFAAQGIKEEEVIKGRAINVAANIQWKQTSNFSAEGSVDKSIADVAFAEEDAITKNAKALSEGKTISFKSESGKEITLRFVPSERGAEYYGAEITLDGKPFPTDVKEFRENGQVPEYSKNEWANSYPILNLKPIPVAGADS